MVNQYITLIERGYCIAKQSYERCYYEDDELLEELEDDELDIEDDMELDNYASSTNYIYYKSKSLNINIYKKANS